MKDPCSCTTKSSDSMIKIDDPGSKGQRSLVLENKNRLEISKVRCDGCLFNSSSQKCDWIVEFHKEDSYAFFIELKGTDIKKAIDQLTSTIKMTKTLYGNHKKSGFIVAKSYPKSRTLIDKARRDLSRNHNCTLHTKKGKDSICI